MVCHATSSLCLTQSDLAPAPDLGSSPAQRLLPAQRQELAVQVLAGTHPVAELARQPQVSRKFLYQQAHTAQHALRSAFEPTPAADEVLFYLPVTKAWLRQLILALVLICHSPYRAVVELLRDLFDWRVSLGTVHNIVHSAVAPARAISRAYHLDRVRVGAHDEIFQAGHPVLVGVDTASIYCYLLSLEDHRDAETWGVRLLELVDRGFTPEAIVADAGSGLRAGQALALPEVPCRGDLFHVLRDLGQVVGYLENRAYGALEDTERRRRQLDSAQRQDGRGRAQSVPSAAQLLRRARATSDAAVALSDEVALSLGWLRHDVLAVAGPCHADRCTLYDFVVTELKRRASRCPHRLEPICRQLENQRDDLLAFARPRRGVGAVRAGVSGLRRTTPATPRRPGARPARPAALDRGDCPPSAAPRSVLRRPGRGGGAGGGDGPGQLAGGEPQQPASELFLPPTTPGLGLLDAAPIRPEPSAAGAQ